MALDEEIVEYLKPLFGDMASVTIEMQKEKLGCSGDLSPEDYKQIAEQIRILCKEMAGDVLANKIYDGLMQLIEEG